MKRTVLTLTLALLFGCIGLAWSQVPAQRVIIVDPTGNHAASVTGGNLGTAGTSSVTVDTISHITSAVHVAGIAQTVAVNCVTGCSASNSTHTAVSQTAAPWTIAHIGAAVHVVVSGRPGVAAHQAGSWTVAATQSGAYNVSAAQSGSLTVQAAHQGGNWNIAHIGGSLHVAGISNVGSGTTAATTRMACHSSVTFSSTADVVVAHANSGMRIFICSIVVVAAGAESISIVEGSGTTCGTGKVGVMGGVGGTMALAANGGFSSISPFPWLSSATAGNAVCIDKSGSGNISGVVTYRGAL